MLKINNRNIEILEKYIDFDPFEGTLNGEKIKCNALYITCVTNDFKISIETAYNIEWVRKFKINDKKDISKYIIGLSYKDEKEWIYLTDECNCTLNKINNNLYEIELDGIVEEHNEKFNIKYKDVFEIK